MELIKKNIDGIEIAFPEGGYRRLFDNIVMVNKVTKNSAQVFLGDGTNYLLPETFDDVVLWGNTEDEALITALIKQGCPLQSLLK